MDKGENTLNIHLSVPNDPNTQEPGPQKKKTKFISLGSKLNDISMRNFPKSLQWQLFAFKFLHYVLLVTAVVLIIFKRIKELNDIKKIEAIEKEGIRDLFYIVTGLIYVKYNLEIINFICYYTFVINLQERRRRTFYFKLTIESLISLIIFVKICIYIFELWTKYGFTGSISHYNIIGEMVLLCVHITIILLYFKIRLKFSQSRLYRKIFRVYYLGKELKLK